MFGDSGVVEVLLANNANANIINHKRENALILGIFLYDVCYQK